MRMIVLLTMEAVNRFARVQKVPFNALVLVDIISLLMAGNV